MKKLISVAMILVMLASSTLGGCSSKGSNTLTLGQWLGMINGAFGMNSYTQEEPYLSSVDEKSEYFNTVQIAAEWGVIAPESDIDPKDKLTWKDALITLVNVGNFTKEDATEDEKIQYAIEHFDSSVRDYWMKRKIDIVEATTLLVTAQNQWVNRIYEESISEVAYGDDVIELSKVTQEDYKLYSDGVITMDVDLASDMKEGDVFVLPDAGDCATPKAFKVKEIKDENGIAEIITDDDLELGEVVDELYVEDTTFVDMDEIEFYGPNGELLIAGTDNVTPQFYLSTDDENAVNLNYTNGSAPKVVQMGAKVTASFEVDGCKVEMTKTSSGLSAKVEMPLTKSDGGPTGYAELEVSDVAITNKIDYSWFKLHSAEVKVDYKTKTTFGIEKEFVDKKGVFAPKWTNGNGNFLTNAKKAVLKDEKATGAKTIKIGSIKLASIGVASFSLDVHLKLKVDGSFEIYCTETGCKGIEYKKGNCRVINTSDKDTDAEIKCKAEGILSIGPTVNAFGFAVIGLSAETGLGAEASVTAHLADADNHLLEEMTANDLPPEVAQMVDDSGLTADVEEVMKLAEEQGGKFYSEESTINLHLDWCTDVKVYFILRIKLSEETLAGKLLKGTKVKVSWELFGSKNATLFNFHIDNFNWSTAKFEVLPTESLCTFNYVPFEGLEEEQEELPHNEDALTDVGEVLMLSDMQITIKEGESKNVSVVQVPNGYELKDIICESKDPKVATIDKNGVVKAVGEGATMIVAKTSDGKYTFACAVIVVFEKDQKVASMTAFIENCEKKGADVA